MATAARMQETRRLTGTGAGARKYDLLTAPALSGLRDEPLGPMTAPRLIALVTARYNWASDTVCIGHDELARLWGVSRRRWCARWIASNGSG
jgi:hypothetical protein